MNAPITMTQLFLRFASARKLLFNGPAATLYATVQEVDRLHGNLLRDSDLVIRDMTRFHENLVTAGAARCDTENAGISRHKAFEMREDAARLQTLRGVVAVGFIDLLGLTIEEALLQSAPAS